MTREEKQTVLKVFRLMLENEGCFHTGICRCNGRLLTKGFTNSDETWLAKDFIDNNLPPTMNGSIYCWTPGDITPRIEWINEQIVKLENELKG